MAPPMESAKPATDEAARRGTALDAPRRAHLLLGLLVVAWLIFSAFAVPRLTNNAIGDLEFSGWSGPLAARIARGEAPYVDFVLPIPPGSFLILAGLARLRGHALLIDELALIAITEMLMALLAYAMVRPFARPRTAVLVACSTLVMLLRGPKECAYDQTAELVAWASIALGVRALFAVDGRHRARLWAAAGALGGLTLAFKQSTAVGVLAGYAGAGAYLALARWRERELDSSLPGARDLAAFVGGVAAGFVLLVIGLFAVGSTPGAFYQAVLADGPSLKGGSLSLLANLASHLVGSPAYPASIALTVAVGLVVVRLSRRPDGFRLGDPRAPAPAESPPHWGLVAGLVAAAFGIAAALLALRVQALPTTVAFWTDRLRFVPSYGLALGCFAFVAMLQGSVDGHRLNAAVLVALATSLLHNLSSPQFRPFYDPNPLVPFAFLYLYAAFERAELPRVGLAVFTLSLAALFSPKLDRALSAQIPIGREGSWAGLYVNQSAMPIVRAALRVRELTTDDDRVLVLPEDLEIAALIGRRRPDLTGAVVFVDQYPRRRVDGDLEKLARALPKVVVIRPREREVWIRMFALWNNNSGARAVTERFLDDWLPNRYRLDSTYSTRFADTMQDLEVWVLR
jgi:hypothetical protein